MKWVLSLGERIGIVEFNRQNTKQLMFLIAFAIVLFLALMNLRYASDVFWWIFNIFKPFLLGLAFAFVANVPMKAIETRLFAGINRKYANSKTWKHLRRPLCLILTIVLILGLIAAIIFQVMPELLHTFETLIGNTPTFFNQLQIWIQDLGKNFPKIQQELGQIQIDWSSISRVFTQMGQKVVSSFSDIMGSTITVATNVFSGIFTFTMGCIFAIYTLAQKEKLQRQIRRLLYAYLPEKKIDRFLNLCRLTNSTFSHFIAGQCTEACILGFLCFIGMNIFHFPYASLISVFVAFMALIPIFGSFFSAVIGGLLILTVDPIQAIYYVIFFLILQQLEGNFIYPHVVGNSVGLPPIWVLLAVTVGGNSMGLVGMLLSIPLGSVIYTLLRKNISRRLTMSKIDRKKVL
ncbi:AI-2E family transporter [Caproicibacterium sp. BJN0003]|uniref:AI-2E family transporter n=1 Tax=Caproicibacterium sp. BJN0003 TaxID=2994078 RepID=UPI002252A7A7|nr:AI-2E family transporter [Caproicibacterium sp. BJN0003]UZT82607.1 AI-2E family transporter [Caproicibacterium sp. BJN0003]